MTSNIKINEKAKNDKNFVSVLIDESGSMDSIRDDVIEGFNAFLAELQEDPSAENTNFSLVTFDSRAYSVRTDNVPLRNASQLNYSTYNPRGGTPLYDAIGRTIKSMEAAVEDIPEPDVVISIYTDGLENASRAYTRQEILKLITDKQAEGWTFTYLATGHDAWAVATDIGFRKGDAAQFERTKAGIMRSWDASSKAILSRRAIENPRLRKARNFFQDEVDNSDGKILRKSS